MKNFYITTAIDYANGKPHLGHAYEKVLADVIARVRRLKGDRVHFLTGLDEHGQKVQQTAENNGIAPMKWCDDMAENFKQLLVKLNISNDDFIRTSEDRHKKVVRELLQKLYDAGEIYKAEYKGFYSTKEEQFLQEKDRVDGKWPSHYGEVVQISESNYFFKLSKHRDWLVQHIEKNPNFIFPKFRAKQVLEFLKEDINDLCISRPKERLAWGIPLPFDESYVTYVWFDALINYISAVGYGESRFKDYWPADIHVIGKDILVPAHGVYWPIMLKAMGVETPKTLLVHGWWQVSGNKMSKSFGNVIDPFVLVEQFGADAFRFFLMREMNVGQDSDFSIELFLGHYHSDLANDLGNLVSRLLNMAKRYCNAKIPKASFEEDPELGLKSLWVKQSKEAMEFFDGFQYHRGIESLFMFIRGINRYAEVRAPWKLAKSLKDEDMQKLQTTIAYMSEGVRVATALLTPIMPSTCEKIRGLFSLSSVELWEGELEWGKRLEGNVVAEKSILFPKVELQPTV